MSRHPRENESTKENNEEVHAISILTQLFKINYKKGKLLNMKQKLRETDHSKNMALTTNQELTCETGSPRKIISDGKSKDSTRERTKKFKSYSMNSNPIDHVNRFDFTNMKIEKKYMYDYKHSRANKSIMDITDKTDTAPRNLPLVERRQKITKPGNLWLKIDSNFKRKF